MGDVDGATALLCAVQENAGITRLLKANADPNIATKEEGITPLMIAAHIGELGPVLELVEAGADPKAVNKQDGANALIMASQSNSVEVVEELVGISDVNYKASDGSTALLVAALEGNHDVARILLD